MPFVDRRHAGRALAGRLELFAMADPVVLGLARGGVEVAAEVAAHLRAPLDALVVRKVGVPNHPELAMGAVAGATIWLNELLIAQLGIPPAVVDRVVAAERNEAARREALYRHGRPPPSIEGRTIIVVDDGLATGATALAAVRALRQLGPRRIVFAAPVCSIDGADQLRQEADEVICVERPIDFRAVSLAYESFPEVSDDTVRRLLDASPVPR